MPTTRVADRCGGVADTLRFIRNAECYAGHGFLENVAALRQISGGGVRAHLWRLRLATGECMLTCCFILININIYIIYYIY